jgi:hypothetical protein
MGVKLGVIKRASCIVRKGLNVPFHIDFYRGIKNFFFMFSSLLYLSTTDRGFTPLIQIGKKLNQNGGCTPFQKHDRYETMLTVSALLYFSS